MSHCATIKFKPHFPTYILTAHLRVGSSILKAQIVNDIMFSNVFAQMQMIHHRSTVIEN